MEKELLNYGLHYLALVCVIGTGIYFGISQNWWAMIFAFYASWWVVLALQYRRRGDRIEQQYHEYRKRVVLGDIGGKE